MPTSPGFWITPKAGSNTRWRRRHTAFSNPGHICLTPHSNFSKVSFRYFLSRPFEPGITPPITDRCVPLGEDSGSIAVWSNMKPGRPAPGSCSQVASSFGLIIVTGSSVAR